MKTIRYNTLIFVLSVVLILLNIVGYMIRMYAFPEKPIMTNAWEYMNSSMFRFISGSLIFPIILILLENKFKIIQAAREKRVKEIEAIKQNKVNKRREILDSINADWNKLYELVNELKYFVVDKGNDQENIRRLSEIQKDLINSILAWDKNINALYYYYPRLKDIEPVYLYFVNLYVTLSTSVALYMKQSIHDPKYIVSLQEAYEVITGTIKNIWYFDFITIIRLKNSRNEVLNIDQEKVKSIDEEVELRVGSLRDSAKYLMEIELEHNNVFKELKSNPSDEFQVLMAEYKEFIKEQATYDIYGFDRFNELRDEYQKVSAEEMMMKLNLFYSEEVIFELSKKIGFFSFLQRLSQPVNDLKLMG